MGSKYRIVVQLEHTACTISCVLCHPTVERIYKKKYTPDLSDPSGAKVFREIDVNVRKLTMQWISQKPDPKELPVDIVMPGSLKDPHTIVRVSRLNIHQQCDLDKILGKKSTPYSLTNDVFASSLGQLDALLPAELTENWKKKTILFVYIDEGVGSFVFHKGSIIRGAGFAGPLGHAIVEPSGQYFDDIRARGCLEAYCSRPSISSNIVNRFFTDRDKSINEAINQPTSTNAFTRALRTTELSMKETLTYEVLNEGIKAKDPLSIQAMNEATTYLGLAISHLIVSLNPHLIVLDGSMIHKLDGFFEQTLEGTRQYTWVDAWNSTKMVSSINDNQSALHGVICAAREERSFYE